MATGRMTRCVMEVYNCTDRTYSEYVVVLRGAAAPHSWKRVPYQSSILPFQPSMRNEDARTLVLEQKFSVAECTRLSKEKVLSAENSDEEYVLEY